MEITPRKGVTLGKIYRTWWPLAASWLLMSVEMPALSAVVARLSQPEINLAAYGGVVFPLALIVESPIIMLLAASTALSKDWPSYQQLRRYMMNAGLMLTIVHVLVAFTPLYDLIVGSIIGAPAEIIEPARVGLRIMTPWTWSIAYRRFHQGVLIRFGHSGDVSKGTAVRLAADALVLSVGYALGDVPGVVVGTLAVAAGVISEAAFIGIIVQPVLKNELQRITKASYVITLRSFLNFYIPLVMTSLLTLIAQPIGSAALSRMPHALESLAMWPVVSGLVFLFRSFGIAYNEVVVALLDEQGSLQNLRRFAAWLIFGTNLVYLIITITPLAIFWLQNLSALSPELAQLARKGLWLTLPMPALAVLQSWYQGAILHSRQTRAVTEAVVVYLVTIGLLLAVGVWRGTWTGLYVGLGAMTFSMLVQTLWLAFRSKSAIEAVTIRDADALQTINLLAGDN